MFQIYNVSEFMFLNVHIKIKFKGKSLKKYSFVKLTYKLCFYIASFIGLG